MPKPDKSDYPPFYQGYVDLAPNKAVLLQLSSQTEYAKELFSGLSEEKADTAYAPDKWSFKELLGHIIDAERIFSYRALCMARGDQQSLPGMDQDAYMMHANFAGRSMKSLIEEYDSVRRATMTFIGSLSADDLKKTGIANNGHFTVNALLHIIVGHELHHLNIIEEKYL